MHIFTIYYATEEKKMIEIKCTAPEQVKLTDLTPFQGDLKKRTAADIDDLISSLHREGLLMPFAVWEHDDKKYLLDGHGRQEALIRASLTDPKIIEQDFPCIMVKAETEEDARKALLQITSSYGSVTKKGVVNFTATITDYRAPVVDKALKRHSLKKTAAPKAKKIIRIAVLPADYDRILALLKQTSDIEVL